MTRQVDYVSAYLLIKRNSNGTYSNSLQTVEGVASDPAPASGAAADKGPFIVNGLNGIVCDTTMTVDNFLLTVLQSVAARAGVALHTDRVFNNATKEYLTGVDGAQFDLGVWRINPELHQLVQDGVPVKYWKNDPDDDTSVIEMTPAEKDVVNAAALPGNIAAKIAKMKKDVTVFIGKHYDQGQQMTILSMWSEALSMQWPNRIAMIGQVMGWVNSVLTYFYGRVAAVTVCTGQSQLDAVDCDFTQFEATDPKISLGTLQATRN